MNAYAIGLSAIAVGHRTLDVIGQNIANANTPGYHRQGVNLVTRTIDGVRGVGVGLGHITRFTAPIWREAILRNNGDAGLVAARLESQQFLEAALGPASDDLGSQIARVFNQIEELTIRPDDLAIRRTVLLQADTVAQQFRTVAADVDRNLLTLSNQIRQTVVQMNDRIQKIADLNKQIALIELRGEQANDLQNQRDQYVSELSQWLDLRIIPQPHGVVNVLTDSGALVVGDFPFRFQVSTTPGGQLQISDADSGQPLTIRGGRLGGMLQEYNQNIPAFRARLDALAAEWIRQFNHIHATGLGRDGPPTAVTATIGVANPTLPLATQNLPFPVVNGTLVVSVTDLATTSRTNYPIPIDPTTQSLQDIANAFNAIPGLNASILMPDGKLQVQASPGFAFDFAGRDTNPPSGGGVPDADTAGLLAGLGILGMFTGIDASSIAVNPALLANPQSFAASRSDHAGDTANLERFAALRDQPLLGGKTFRQDYTELAASIGAEVQTLQQRNTTLNDVQRDLFAREQAVIGVDLDEQFVHLLNYQRMVDAASRYIAVVNTAMDAVLRILD